MAGAFVPEISRDAKGHSAAAGELLGETGEERFERVLPAGEEDMDVLALRNARAVQCARRQAVTLEDEHLVEGVRERSRRREPGHPGTNDDSSSRDRRHSPPSCVTQGITHLGDATRAPRASSGTAAWPFARFSSVATPWSRTER